MEMDEIFRARLFLLLIAAEEGWATASGVAFRKAGNMADKDLAKELVKKEKKKREAAKEHRPKIKPKRSFRYPFGQPQVQLIGLVTVEVFLTGLFIFRAQLPISLRCPQVLPRNRGVMVIKVDMASRVVMARGLNRERV